MNISYPFSAWTSIEGKFIITTVLRAIMRRFSIPLSIDRFEFRFLANRSTCTGNVRAEPNSFDASPFDEKVKADTKISIHVFFEI